jgi:hypothetical protein
MGWQTGISSVAFLAGTQIQGLVVLNNPDYVFEHVFSFFAILIPLWVLSPRVPATDVFTTFLDGGGWGNVGLACLVGMLSPVFALLGADAATHMGPHSHLPPVRR